MQRAIQTSPARRPGSRRRRRSAAPAALLLACLLALAPSRARAAALLEESFELAAGWNLIHVSVEPLDRDPSTALAAIDWESLWTWLPSETEPRGGRWLALHRSAPAFLGTLFQLSGPHSYLLEARSGGTLRLRGAVRSARQPLRGGAYQLFGPGFDRASPPTFAAHFSRVGVKEHIGAAFALVGQTYRPVASGDVLRPGAAYWVLPARDIPAPEPLRLGSGLGGIRFAPQTTLQEVVVDAGLLAGTEGGGGATSRQLALRVLPSAGGGSNTEWLEVQSPDGTFAPIGSGATIEMAAEQSEVRIAFRARREALATAGGGDQAAVVELLSPEGKLSVGAELEVPGLQGTWLGEATITEVERAAVHGGGFAPAPPVSIALILELSSAGAGRLQPCVRIDSSRDGRNVSYRFEAALFQEPLALTGAAGPDGKSGTLVGTLAMPPGHPLNPYRHRYHPEHGQGLDVLRSPRLRFGATLPGAGQDDAGPFATVGILAGVYEEEIVGLTQEPIHVRGAFRLRRLPAGAATPCVAAGP